MSYPLQYNCEGYFDPTRFYAMKNILQDRRPGVTPDWVYRRGEIYLVDFGQSLSSRAGSQHVIMLQTNGNNIDCPVVSVAPIIRGCKPAAEHYTMPFVPSLNGPGTVLLEEIMIIPKTRMRARRGMLNEYRMNAINEKIICILGHEIPFEVEAP